MRAVVSDGLLDGLNVGVDALKPEQKRCDRKRLDTDHLYAIIRRVDCTYLANTLSSKLPELEPELEDELELEPELELELEPDWELRMLDREADTSDAMEEI